MDVNVILSITHKTYNKTRYPGEESSYERYEGPLDALVMDHVMKGGGINASPLINGTRGGKNSEGGNTIIIDLDDGIPKHLLTSTPTYLSSCAAYWPSCSSGVVAEKKKVDGRDRGRIAAVCAREFKTDNTLDENGFAPSKERQHLERIAVTEAIVTGLCDDLGIPRLDDRCYRSVSQCYYGNAGEGTIYYDTTDADGNEVKNGGSYECSTDRWVHFNPVIISEERMDQIIRDYKERHPEIYTPRVAKTTDQSDRETEIARYILENDLISEDDLMVYETAIQNVAGACKVICESLLDPWLETMERVNDGHEWRLPSKLIGSWNRLDSDYDRSVGSLINLADQGSPGWRNRCPHFGRRVTKNCFEISEAAVLMKSIDPANIIY